MADDNTYTDPALRERLKEEIKAGGKGGKPGQWSARKSQLLAHDYEHAGGGYTSEQRTPAQEHLEEWTEQDWRTEDGKPALRGDAMARYLPAAAWKALSPAQRKATNAQKLSDFAQQYVDNTPAAKDASKHAQETTQHAQQDGPHTKE